MAAPTLKELKDRQCSADELQSALVMLIELHNKLESDINKMIKNGRIRSEQEAAATIRYGI
jgi:hypothetical protein